MPDEFKDDFGKNRKEHEPPAAIARYGWRFHHVGIPTTKIMPDEEYLGDMRMYVSGFESSPYGIEWMRFEQDSPISELIRTMPHVAFEVDDLEVALEGKDMLGEISSPCEGIRVAMIIDNGAPVELLEISRNRR